MKQVCAIIGGFFAALFRRYKSELAFSPFDPEDHEANSREVDDIGNRAW